ncbi:MAG: Wzz/FepE/Etk N-terminal domain-containing protein [Bacteroidales bacterium]|nr:Wzz/FepE/Etk N-terminal domain-containing protein [Bacteroidales bacterium]
MKEFDTEYKDFVEGFESEIDFGKLWEKLKKSWKVIALCVVIGAVLGLVIGFSIPKRYKAVTKLAPELSNSAVNRLSSLASLAGMNANILGSSDAVYPMIYPEIVYSTSFLTELFSMPVELPEVGQTDLYDYLLNYTKHPWWSSVMGLPGKVAGLFHSNKDDGFQTGRDSVDSYRLTAEQGGVAKAIGACIDASVDKKTLMITIQVSAQNPVVAADLAKYTADKLKDYVVDYRTGKARESVVYLEDILQEAKSDYYSAQKRYASYVDSHHNTVLQSARIEADRLQNEMNLAYQLYNSVAQQLQSARTKVQQETPIFAEIVPASVPLRPYAPSKKRILIAFMMLGFIGGCAHALLKK